jgi:hypothetical protein
MAPTIGLDRDLAKLARSSPALTITVVSTVFVIANGRHCHARSARLTILRNAARHLARRAARGAELEVLDDQLRRILASFDESAEPLL